MARSLRRRSFVPDEFERIVKGSVEALFDPRIYTETLEQQEEEQRTVLAKAKELLDEKMKKIREDEE